ncbi:unnamed protein product [Urochloa humidicola]
MGCQCHHAISSAGLLVILVVALNMSLAVASNGRRPLAKVPAIYVFGDSTMDVGNNNYLPGDLPRANHPNGVDFPSGTRARPTKRRSNGYNIADFIAKSMGFKMSPPAYLSLTRNSSHRRLILKGLRGVSYASAGAGILNSTYAGKCIPLSKQVRYFGATRAAMVATLGACAANKLLSKSLFLFSIGSTDIGVFAAAQQQQSNTSTVAQLHHDVAAYYSILVSNYSAAINDLYGMGARKFGIINAGLIGCTPSARLQSPTGACAGGANALAAGFNDALRTLMASLHHRLRGLSYSVGDLYGVMKAVIVDPRAAGLSNVDSACCGSGRLGAQGGECQPNSTLCVDRRRYLFWDSPGHPTQRVAQLIALAFYDGPAKFAAPVNFKQLMIRSRVTDHTK